MGKYETKYIFSRNLSRILMDHGISQADLASMMGVATSSVSAWCNGDKMPRMDKIEWIANHFGVMKSELLEDETLPSNIQNLQKMKKIPELFY